MNVFCPHCGSEFAIAILGGESVSRNTSSQQSLTLQAKQNSTETVQNSRSRTANLHMSGSGSGSEIRQIGSGSEIGKCAYSHDFLFFWAAYPRKRNKGEAWKAWTATANLQCADLLNALSWQVHSEEWRRDGGKYIPHPATYIRARAWEDEPGIDIAPLADKTPEQRKLEAEHSREAAKIAALRARRIVP